MGSWTNLSTIIETERQFDNTTKAFVNALNYSTSVLTKMQIPSKTTAIDGDCEWLRALCRQSERHTWKTKNIDDIRQARQLQKNAILLS